MATPPNVVIVMVWQRRSTRRQHLGQQSVRRAYGTDGNCLVATPGPWRPRGLRPWRPAGPGCRCRQEEEKAVSTLCWPEEGQVQEAVARQHPLYGWRLCQRSVSTLPGWATALSWHVYRRNRLLRIQRVPTTGWRRRTGVHQWHVPVHRKWPTDPRWLWFSNRRSLLLVSMHCSEWRDLRAWLVSVALMAHTL
jgi:hypothetical protein